MTFALPRNVSTIPRPFVIACEGYSDLCLIDELLQHHKITNCCVGCPSRDFAPNLPEYMAAVKGIVQTKGLTLAGVLVVVDADISQADAFANASTALANGAFPVPSGPFKVEGANPRTAVYVMPGEGREGTLEHLLLDATFLNKPKYERYVTKFVSRILKRHWFERPVYTANQYAKMRMSSIVGASCKSNPWASAAGIWHEQDNPVPVDSPCFSHLTGFLRTFSQ